MVGDSVDHLCINDERLESDKVGNKEANLVTFVEYIKRRLLLKGISRSKNSMAKAFS